MGGAVDFGAATDGLPASPMAFVVPLRQTAERDAAGGLLAVGGEFGVLVAVSFAGGRAAGAAEDLSGLSAAARAALEGHRLPCARAIRWEGGALHQIGTGAIWYLDRYTVVYPV